MYTVLFFISITSRVLARNQDFIDNDTVTDEPSLAGTPNHPYVGIPIGTWKITDLGTDERKLLCQQQQEFCTTECGGDRLVKKNFCNLGTMGWICKCQNHVPDNPPYQWPVALAECHGRENSCIKGCTYGATKEICIKACNKYFKCNQAGSPLSGLRIEREDQIPSYSLPSGGPMTSNNMSIKDVNRETMKYYATAILVLMFVVGWQ